MQKVRSIGDALHAIRDKESDHNLIMTVLLGLPKEYMGFVSALNTHRTEPTFEQFHHLLIQKETEVWRRARTTVTFSKCCIPCKSWMRKQGRARS